MTMPVRLCCLLTATLLIVPCGSAQDVEWPWFLGPDHDGIARRAPAVADTWTKGQPEVLWRVDVGPGFAGPSIHRNSVFLLDRPDDEQDVLRRLSLENGSEIWRSAYPAPGKLPYNGSRTTPATDGKHVYTIGPFGHVRAVQYADGTPVWNAQLLEDWNAKRPRWGVAQSPLLHGNLLITAPWGGKAALVAYEKMTGNVAWVTPNRHGVDQDYSSPLPLTIAGKEMIVAAGKNGKTLAVDPETGKELWFYDDYFCKIHIASPVLVPGDRILLTGGYNAGSAMFKVTGTGDGYATETLWQNKNLGSQIAQPLVHKGFIYANSNNTKGGLVCLDFDGNLQWQTQRKPWFDIGNILIAEDVLFIVNGRNGHLVLVDPSPRAYRERGRAPVMTGPQVWGPLAYDDGILVLRDQKSLACLDVSRPE